MDNGKKKAIPQKASSFFVQKTNRRPENGNRFFQKYKEMRVGARRNRYLVGGEKKRSFPFPLGERGRG